MRDDLALARVCNTVSGVEQASRDGDKGIIKVGFQRAIAMGVNDLERRRIGYREVIRCDTNEGPCAQKGVRCPRRSERSKFLQAHHTFHASGGQLLNGAPVWRRGLTTSQRSGPARGQGMIAGHEGQ